VETALGTHSVPRWTPLLVWMIWSSGKIFVPAGNRTAYPRLSCPQPSHYMNELYPVTLSVLWIMRCARGNVPPSESPCAALNPLWRL